ncbi:MAG: metallophosphoesterase [Candidatus Korobacteraceae bacterium]|jgi:sphingomyelin phosphodiesterase acid-like 3
MSRERVRGGNLVRLVLVLGVLCACHIRASAASASPSEKTFLLASDVHFNPMADASLVTDLAAANPTQWESILARSKSTSFSQYGEDTNWWLLQSSLDQMRTTLPHPAFILLTGDLIAHQFPQTYLKTTHDTNREDYRKFVLKTVEFVALEFRKRFPDTKILFTPGNNDENCGNYSVRADGTFLHDTADIVRKLAQGDDEFKGSWEALGSYDIPHPTIPGIRIISLNTVFLSARYQAAKFSEDCGPTDSTAPADLFTWLESRLNAAQQAHQKVWLMFHIPPGIDGYSSVVKYQVLSKSGAASATEKMCASAVVPMWQPKWTSQFQTLLTKYEGTVIVSLAGHTHTDDFRLINSAGAKPELVLISPAISPVYRQNPAFRVVTFANDGSLSDASVYYLTNLELASSKTRGEWRKEYTFSQEWKMGRPDAASLAALYEQIKTKPEVRDEWLKLYNVSSSAAYLPAHSAPGFYCAVEELDPETYSNCYCSPTVSHGSFVSRP